MNIFFDLDIKFPGIYEKSKPEEKLALETIWNYVYDRVILLYDEIEKEESIDDKPKAIMIYLMNDPRAIQPRGYSDALCDKINGCFNENDAKLLWDSVDKALQSLLN